MNPLNITDEIQTLYRILGFEIRLDTKIPELEPTNYMVIEQNLGGYFSRAFVICFLDSISQQDYNKLVALGKNIQDQDQYIVISLKPFEQEIRYALENNGFSCIEYLSLLSTLVPIKSYLEKLTGEKSSFFECRRADIKTGEQSSISECRRADIKTGEHAGSPLQNIVRPELQAVMNWTKEQNSRLLLINGYQGIGKTTLLHQVVLDLANNFLQNPFQSPAPIWLDLKNLTKPTSLKNLITEEFAHYGIHILNYEILELFIKKGKIVLIVDSTDEMIEYSQKQDREQTLRSIMSTEYAKLIVSTTPETFQIVSELIPEQISQKNEIHMAEFDDELINAYLQAIFKDQWEKAAVIIRQNPLLVKLAKTPFYLRMIVWVLLELAQKNNVQNTDVISTYIRRRITNRKKTDENQYDILALSVLLEIAWQMWEKQTDIIPFHPLISFIKIRILHQKGTWHPNVVKQIMTPLIRSGILIKNGRDHLEMTHRIFQKYLIAIKLYKSLKDGHNKGINMILGKKRLDTKIIDMLISIDKEKHSVVASLQSILKNKYVPDASENALLILYRLAIAAIPSDERNISKIQAETGRLIPKNAKLAGAILKDMVLTGIDLTSADLCEANLTGVILDDAILSDADLTESIIENASAKRIIAINTKLTGSTINNTSFEGADLSQTEPPINDL